MVDGSTAKQLQWNREGVAATKLALKCVLFATCPERWST